MNLTVDTIFDCILLLTAIVFALETHTKHEIITFLFFLLAAYCSSVSVGRGYTPTFNNHLDPIVSGILYVLSMVVIWYNLVNWKKLFDKLFHHKKGK